MGALVHYIISQSKNQGFYKLSCEKRSRSTRPRDPTVRFGTLSHAFFLCTRRLFAAAVVIAAAAAGHQEPEHYKVAAVHFLVAAASAPAAAAQEQ